MRTLHNRFITAAILGALVLAANTSFAQTNTCEAQCRTQVKACKGKCTNLRKGLATLKACKSKCDKEKKACYRTCG